MQTSLWQRTTFGEPAAAGPGRWSRLGFGVSGRTQFADGLHHLVEPQRLGQHALKARRHGELEESARSVGGDGNAPDRVGLANVAEKVAAVGDGQVEVA